MRPQNLEAQQKRMRKFVLSVSKARFIFREEEMITKERQSAMRETATQMKDGDNRFAINLREAAHTMIELLDALDEAEAIGYTNFDRWMRSDANHSELKSLLQKLLGECFDGRTLTEAITEIKARAELAERRLAVALSALEHAACTCTNDELLARDGNHPSWCIAIVKPRALTEIEAMK